MLETENGTHEEQKKTENGTHTEQKKNTCSQWFTQAFVLRTYRNKETALKPNPSPCIKKKPHPSDAENANAVNPINIIETRTKTPGTPCIPGMPRAAAPTMPLEIFEVKVLCLRILEFGSLMLRCF